MIELTMMGMHGQAMGIAARLPTILISSTGRAMGLAALSGDGRDHTAQQGKAHSTSSTFSTPILRSRFATPT
jgi:hypothetical protein